MSETMDRNEILARICVVIADIADDMNHVAISPKAQLERDLGLDSFERIELLNAIEGEFSLSFSHPQDRELTRADATVADLVATVETQLAKTAAIAYGG